MQLVVIINGNGVLSTKKGIVSYTENIKRFILGEVIQLNLE